MEINKILEDSGSSSQETKINKKVTDQLKIKDQIKQFNENKVKNYEQMYGKVNNSVNIGKNSGPIISKKRNRRVFDQSYEPSENLI